MNTYQRYIIIVLGVDVAEGESSESNNFSSSGFRQFFIRWNNEEKRNYKNTSWNIKSLIFATYIVKRCFFPNPQYWLEEFSEAKNSKPLKGTSRVFTDCTYLISSS